MTELLQYILAVIVILILVFVSFKRKRHDWGVVLPVPPKLPIIGNGHLLVGDAVDFMNFVNECWHKYGRRYRVEVLNSVFVVLSDPRDVEIILSSNDLLEKAEDYEFLYPWLGEGLLTSSGDKWHRHRKFLTPAFHFSILKHFVPVFDQKTDLFVQKLGEMSDGQTFDVYPLVTESTLEQLMETAMGIKFDSKNNTEYVNAVKTMTNILMGRMKAMFTRFDIIFKLSSEYKVFKKTLKYLHEFTNRMIRERKELLQSKGYDLQSIQRTTEDDELIGSTKNIAFLDLLLLSEVDGKKLSDKSIREEVDTFLFEGHDTTASAISFTMYLLGDNQDVQQKLFEEQARIFEDDDERHTTHNDINEMKYLDLAIRETLRLYPSVPMIGRHIRNETKINDLNLPAGCDIGINVFNMGRDPEVFKDPLVYRPERFLPEELSKRRHFSVISFSAGPRNCIGQKFAMYEMKMTLSKVIRNFKILSANAEPLRLAGDIVLKSANGISIRLVPRKK